MPFIDISVAHDEEGAGKPESGIATAERSSARPLSSFGVAASRVPVPPAGAMCGIFLRVEVACDCRGIRIYFHFAMLFFRPPRAKRDEGVREALLFNSRLLRLGARHKLTKIHFR